MDDGDTSPRYFHSMMERRQEWEMIRTRLPIEALLKLAEDIGEVLETQRVICAPISAGTRGNSGDGSIAWAHIAT